MTQKKKKNEGAVWALCLAFVLFIPVIDTFTGENLRHDDFIFLRFPATLGLIYISYKTFHSKLTVFGLLPLSVAAGISAIFYNLIGQENLPIQISIGISIFACFVSIKYWSSSIAANSNATNVSFSDNRKTIVSPVHKENTPKEDFVTETYTRKGFYRLWVSLLGLAKVKSVTFYPDQIYINFKGWNKSVEYEKIDQVRTTGIILKKISFISQKHTLYVSGLSRSDAKRFYEAYEIAASASFLRTYQRFSAEIDDLTIWIESLEARTFYLRSSVYQSQIQRAKTFVKSFSERIPDQLKQSEESAQISKMRRFLEENNELREKINDEYITLEIDRHAELYDKIEKNPLTEEQRRSVVVDEDANLVVAAAGSGKTSVIVAKAAWLIKNRLRRPSEILMLAFGKDAQIEMSERINERIKNCSDGTLKVSTFHALGMNIIGATTGHKPNISKIAEGGDNELGLFIRKTIAARLNEDWFYSLIMKWFSEFFAPYESEFNFKSQGEYWDYIRKNKIISLNGDAVKSFEECEIANFLYVNGIKYVYEADYEHDTSTEHKTQYRPDFYLPDYEIYIEHLGLKGFGRTAPFVDRRNYIQSTIWKRRLHKVHRTTLIETYSCEKDQGILTENLKNKLSNLGVQFTPISSDEVFSVLNERKQLDDFTKLVTTFLGHYKGAQLSEADLRDRIDQLENTDRYVAFINIFLPIYQSYQEYLGSTGKIDFHDMIIEATQLVKNGKYKSPYRYIMVDEFQDISAGRAKLLKALQNSDPDTQLFCVGDDWQAIYRFTGADINIMKMFPENFGASARSNLSKTFRCEEKITGHATHFILKNEFQISKNVEAFRRSKTGSVIISIRKSDEIEQIRAIVSLISDEIAQQPNTTTKSVLFLGRYRAEILSAFAEFDYYQFIKNLDRDYDNLDLLYKTMHGSKGLEADYVIILDHGFPSEKVDDPILNLVLAEPELYPNAEERRLFYVALTRAKEKVFIATQSGARSSFIDEIIKSPIGFDVLGTPIVDEPKCPKCVKGRLILREPHAFWSCRNRHRFECEHKEEACPYCKKGYLNRDVYGEITCNICEQKVVECPMIDCDGFLQQRNSPTTGSFWGCTKYFDDANRCNYTRNELYENEKPEMGYRKSKKMRGVQKSQKTNRQFEYKNHGKPWNEDENIKLRRLVRDGLSNETISEKMERSPKSIQMQRERIFKSG